MRLSLLPCLVLFHLATQAQEPTAANWIWSAGEPAKNQTLYFSRHIPVGEGLVSAWATGSADDVFRFMVNGSSAFNGNGHDKPVMANLAPLLKVGTNWLGIMARNYDGDAGVQVALDLVYRDGTSQRVVTDAAWICAATRPAGPPDPAAPGPEWSPVRVICPVGQGRWGRIPETNRPGEATPVEKIKLPPGFVVERLYSVPGDEQGSWVSMTLDANGRFLVGDQGGKVYRFRAPAGSKVLEPSDVQPIPFPAAGFAQGLLFAFNSLYMVGQVNREPGVYRFRDTNNDDQPDQVDKILALPEVGHEHGAHNLVLGPDGKRIFLVGGNLCPLPEPLAGSRVTSSWAEDQVLPRAPSTNQLFADVRAPGGWIVSFDRTGRDVVLEAAGLRNAYDLVFNRAGDLFTFDSDMEWDIGMPWYRPTRLLHVLPGADFGWRHGSGPWPDDVEDSFGAVIDVGRGSPTGLALEEKSDFPHEYRGALFLADWTFGRIFCARLTTQGASYSATLEPFLSGRPLAITRLLFHPDDGALYFITGGRRTQSGLYRVRWSGAEPGAARLQPFQNPVPLDHLLRRKLEELITLPDPRQLDLLWSNLTHTDRAIRHAARTALEKLPWEVWSDRALTEENPAAAGPALLALSRVREAKPAFDTALRDALLAHSPAKQGDRVKRVLLRARQIASARHPHPAGYAKGWEGFLPSPDPAVQRMVRELRVAAGDPSVVPELVARLGQGGRQPDLMQAGFWLRTLSEGWTPDLRAAYFQWITRAQAAVAAGEWVGGDHARHFLGIIKDEALAVVPQPDRAPLRALLAEPAPAPPPVPSRAFVRAWTVADLLEGAADVGRRRHFDVGRQVYQEARCGACHLLNGSGGAVGPDLTLVANKYGYRDLLREVLQPSAVVAEPYALTLVRKRDGTTVSGLAAAGREGETVLVPDPLKPGTRVAVPAAEIESVTRSTVSAMPLGLLNRFTREEILDLLAYLNAAGNPEDPAFE